MNFIRRIAEGKVDEATHKKLSRYGKGEYERAIISIKKGKKDLKIKASYDWSNDIFGMIAERVKTDSEVKGKIIAPRDFGSELDVEASFSKRGKMYTAEINTVMKPEQMKSVSEKFGGDFLLLNVKVDSFKLGVKSSIPKPGGKIKEDFCSATLPLDVVDEFAFDFDRNFSDAKIINKFVITDLVIPKEYEDDFSMARLMAKRKGKLIRSITVDGKSIEKEYSMEA